MNYVAEEILSNLSDADDELKHYGMPRRSGRYPWGSGEDPYQHNRDFLSRVEELKKNGWVENAENVKKEFGVSLSEYRNEKSWATYERRLVQVKTAERLREKEGLGPSEIGRRMGISESTVRSLLNKNSKDNMEKAMNTVNFLKERLNEQEFGMLDVGKGTEIELNVSRTKLNAALYYLQGEGYGLYEGGVPQPTNPGKQTIQQVLCRPGIPYKEIYNYEKIGTIKDYTSHDDGKTFDKLVYPASLDSKRIMIRGVEDGGAERDGLVELRRGVEDISLGDSHYSQVRILVDGKKYIKGMAIYSDDMPPGVDVIVNSNKSNKLAKLDHLKDIKTDDPINPFGAAIKPNGQSYYYDEKGKKHLRVINKRADEGDWTEWKDTLPSQFLGKQSLELAQRQLDLAKADKQAEFDEIMSITNPTVKKYWLNKFASDCDSAAVDLKAAALPGQKYHVIIPINAMKDNEIYAPRYENGSKLALIRFPHGGRFEIPILTVNNKKAEAKKILGPDFEDAVGINATVADRLSGADFDGDTVMCIPTHDKNGRVKIINADELEDLKGFNPKDEYPEVKGMKYMKDPVTGSDQTQKQMGEISNLITDMTLAGATEDEMARAVKHSMVVIDAKKHKLNYKQSEIDNEIKALKNKYQRKIDENGELKIGGASTILSRAKGQYDVPKRQGTPRVNIEGTPWYDPNRPQGALIYKTASDAYYIKREVNKRTGEVKEIPSVRTQKSTQMAETDDAYSLVSLKRNPMELVYAEYANSMKAMANAARVAEYHTPNMKVNKSAKETYANEIQSLNDKLTEALINTPRERQAIRQTNADVKAKKLANPNMTKEEIKKANQQSLSANRAKYGSVSRRERNIVLSDKEWEAIQAGAISDSKLKQILDNADAKELRRRATPRTTTTLSEAKINKIKHLSKTYTMSEIADVMGVSVSTVSHYLKE